MNYKKIYSNIIKYRKENPINKNDGYSELHHILPRSLGGKNTHNNLVRLRAKEHYTCHLLLTKMYKEGTSSYYKMITAWNNMNASSSNQYISKGSMYEFLKIEFSKAMSFNQSGVKNSRYNMISIMNIKTLKRKFVKNNFNYSDEWIPTKKLDYNKIVNNISIEDKSVLLKKSTSKRLTNFITNSINKDLDKLINEQKKEIIKNTSLENLKIITKNHLLKSLNNKFSPNNYEQFCKYYEEYKKIGFIKFCEKYNYNKSQQNLVMRFKENIPYFNPQRGISHNGHIKNMKKYCCIVDNIKYDTLKDAFIATGISAKAIKRNLVNGIFDRKVYEKNCIKRGVSPKKPIVSHETS